MLKILIADDHEIVRKGLMLILHDGFPTANIEEATNTDELLQKAFASTWDLVITDISMPGKNFLEAIAKIKQHYPDLPVLVLSIYSADQYALRCLKAGASGYLTKDAAPMELISAAKQVLLGKRYISPTVAEKLVQNLNEVPTKNLYETLSDREFEVLRLIAKGMSVSDIANQLSLGVTTISTYRARLLEKMKLKSNAELILYAIEHNLI
jgi:two-component system, NarL family, invasion response regulator UvrY